MTAIGDHCNNIRSWLNFSYDDPTVTSWTRMFEETVNVNVRCKHMIAIDTGTIVNERVLLPSDWLELDFVRIVGSKPLRFRGRDEFYTNDNNDPNYNSFRYSISGNYLLVGNTQNGLNSENVEITYFQEIPPLSVNSNWLMNHYPGLYVFGTMVAALAYGVEDERAAGWAQKVSDYFGSINNEWLASKSSGSRLTLKRRQGFG